MDGSSETGGNLDECRTENPAQGVKLSSRFFFSSMILIDFDFSCKREKEGYYDTMIHGVIVLNLQLRENVGKEEE